MSELEIVGAPQSTFVRTVRITCEEKGVSYRLTTAMPGTPEVTAIHPLGKIPVMRHGQVQLFESKAIATYIDRAFPGAKLFPDDAIVAAKIEQWVSLANTTLFPVIISYLQSYYFPQTADGQPDRKEIANLWPTVRAHMMLLNEAVAATGHLVETSFTYADMNLLPVLNYLRSCPESNEMLANSKELSKYFDQHSKRSSFQATVPPPFSELRATN